MACSLNGAQSSLTRGALALAVIPLLTAAPLLAGCGSDSDPEEPEPGGSAGSSASAGAGGSSSSAGSGGGAGQPPVGSGGSEQQACENIITEYPPASANHVSECSALSFDSNPPAGGDHYGVWAAFTSYSSPVPPGYLVHSLEHGAVVFWYNCPEGCAGEVEQAQAMIDELPLDPLCVGSGAQRRAILVPSPELDVRWAASSWGYVIKSSCFDAAALRTFYIDHVGRGREDLCVAGQAIPSDACP